MQSFYHVTIGLRGYPREKFFEFKQSLTHDSRRRGPSHCAADGAVKHPLRNLERPVELAVLQETAACWLTWLRHQGADRNAAIKPRVPGISDYAGVGNVGLRLLICTTGIVRMRALGVERLKRSTASCHLRRRLRDSSLVDDGHEARRVPRRKQRSEARAAWSPT